MVVIHLLHYVEHVDTTRHWCAKRHVLWPSQPEYYGRFAQYTSVADAVPNNHFSNLSLPFRFDHQHDER